ncbi:hypothetical protein F0Q53_05080 [Anaplasma marginale]|uniref:Uncharacterized protein n=1 Tax=Anaplasma marginale TaxID=770 RepID=A0A643CK07_ANAMA|nr:hypothetical protein F0Q53_05080 [Anaplasma marginale]KAB0450717.1 hypothetical protein FY207_05090 [Anaplasma marginale]RCL19552.1 hypothetical protein DOS86_03910 [Anaplasma marginale]
MPTQLSAPSLPSSAFITDTVKALGTTYITKPLSIHSWHPSLTWYHTASPNLWYLLLPLALSPTWHDHHSSLHHHSALHLLTFSFAWCRS